MEANVYDKGPTPDASPFNKVGNPKPQKPKAPAKGGWAEWLALAGLIALSLIPVIAGAVRLTELTGGAEVTPDNARFFASPLPVMVHIFSASLYALLGAFQFVPGLRRRRPSWHRTAGRLLVVPCGLIAALSGLWMTLFYPWPVGDGVILYGLRLLFGSAMVMSIVLGVAATRVRLEPAPQPASIDRLPVSDASQDVVFVLFAAHEIRDADDRVRFFAEARRALAPGGLVAYVGQPNGHVAPLRRLGGGMVRQRLFGQPVVAFIANVNRDDLLVLKELAESGKVTPVIDRTYPLAETPAALSYLGTTRARGKVVITV